MVVRGLEVRSRSPFADGARFEGRSYERIDALVSFAVDPDHPANAPIVDLGLAPRGDDGTVTFEADLVLVSPVDPALASGRLVIEPVNRGQPLAPRVLNRTPYPGAQTATFEPGDGFLFRHGYAVAHLGWQWDVLRETGRLGLDAPPALIDGRPIEGRTVVEIRPTVRQTTRLLANRCHRPSRAADLEEADALLTVRDWDDGPVTLVPRDRWRFAKEAAGRIEPSAEHVYLEGGFEPGRQYHLVYTTRGAPVVGTGLLALRDTAAFLRSRRNDNPLSGHVERVYGFGMSQSGRLLRHYVYLGLNRDEEGRAAYDGLIPHVAGARRGEFNHRFAQPSVQLVPGFGHLFPFADDPQEDPYSRTVDGLLARQRAAGAVPKVMYINSAAEYWRGDSSLAHIDATGTRDLDPASETRHYLLASTQHFPGEVPQVDYNDHDGARARYGFNTIELTPLVRAALVNLDRWVSEAVEPPPSAVPRLDDGTAVPRDAVLDVLAAFGRFLPAADRLPVLREVELGPDAHRGIGRHPATEGATYPCLVSAVDEDGNEVAGIALPDVTVPLGTHTGFNPRHPDTGAPEQIVSMQGLTWFFARTREERRASGDPRPSIEERYTDRAAYLDRVREQAERLAAARYLLEEDVAIVVADAAQRWDYVARGAPLDDSARSRATAS